MMQNVSIAFVGAGAMARAHAYAISALPFYYQNMGKINRTAVTSATPESRREFAAQFGFKDTMETDDLWERGDIDTVFILGPNVHHYRHLKKVLGMKSITRVYVEKPICVTKDEEYSLLQLTARIPEGIVIQAGFQFLQMAAIRKALQLWRRGDFGDLIHFQARYLHSSYLEQDYREQRRSRLKPFPEGGALVDLGSHLYSIIVAFLGQDLKIVSAEQSGRFNDVTAESDLCTVALAKSSRNSAIGTIVASRISAGAGEVLELELSCTNGSLRFSTIQPEVLKVFYSHDGNEWKSVYCASDYFPFSSFPSRHVSAGWLRSLIHAHYLFFGGIDESAKIPDLNHALAVQRLINVTGEKLASNRSAHTPFLRQSECGRNQ